MTHLEEGCSWKCHSDGRSPKHRRDRRRRGHRSKLSLPRDEREVEAILDESAANDAWRPFFIPRWRWALRRLRVWFTWNSCHGTPWRQTTRMPMLVVWTCLLAGSAVFLYGLGVLLYAIPEILRALSP